MLCSRSIKEKTCHCKGMARESLSLSNLCSCIEVSVVEMQEQRCPEKQSCGLFSIWQKVYETWGPYCHIMNCAMHRAHRLMHVYVLGQWSLIKRD